MVLRNKFWVWGHVEGSHTPEKWGLPRFSTISPVDGARYLDIPNMIMVKYEGKPGLEEYPVKYYEEFLEHVKRRYEGQYWHVLPREMARYWRENVKGFRD